MARFTVGGTPWEELTEDQHQNIIKNATEVVSEIVGKHVQNMIEEGKTIDEINKFLGVNKKLN